jgi:hypothetical protein
MYFSQIAAKSGIFAANNCLYESQPVLLLGVLLLLGGQVILFLLFQAFSKV